MIIKGYFSFFHVSNIVIWPCVWAPLCKLNNDCLILSEYSCTIDLLFWWYFKDAWLLCGFSMSITLHLSIGKNIGAFKLNHTCFSSVERFKWMIGGTNMAVKKLLTTQSLVLQTKHLQREEWCYPSNPGHLHLTMWITMLTCLL